MDRVGKYRIAVPPVVRRRGGERKCETLREDWKVFDGARGEKTEDELGAKCFNYVFDEDVLRTIRKELRAGGGGEVR